jgi:hypothetical protein
MSQSEFEKHRGHQTLPPEIHQKMINLIKTLWFWCFNEKIDYEFAEKLSFFIATLQEKAK